MKNMSTFVIAEAGVNHNGDVAIAHQLVDVAADAKANAIKFQTFNADKLSSKRALLADYQRAGDDKVSQQQMLKKLELSIDEHLELKKHCDEKDIEFMSTAFDHDSADFLVRLGIKRIKVPSGEIINHPFIRHLSKFKLPMIISTGMAHLEEIIEAKNVIENAWAELSKISAGNDLQVLHCTSLYPAPLEEINLHAITLLQETLDLPIGYSDHTLGIDASIMAVALGACTIEKHFTLDKNAKGPDHKASLEPGELRTLVEKIRNTEIALGAKEKFPTEAELKMRTFARRSLTIIRDVKAGDRITEDDIAILRPGSGIEPKFLSDVLERKTKVRLNAGHTLTWGDLDD